MAFTRFYGKVGYAVPTETSPGVWDDVITETSYFGNVTRNTRQLANGQKVNDDLTVSNSISIVADAYAIENLMAIRYVEWLGSLWIVTNVEVLTPRLLLTLGGVYNGPTGSPPSSP